MTDFLDDKDKKILQVLKDRGDFTSRQIAKKTLLPVTTVYNRLKKLKEFGVIKKFTVELDQAKLDKGFMVFKKVGKKTFIIKTVTNKGKIDDRDYIDIGVDTYV